VGSISRWTYLLACLLASMRACRASGRLKGNEDGPRVLLFAVRFLLFYLPFVVHATESHSPSSTWPFFYGVNGSSSSSLLCDKRELFQGVKSGTKDCWDGDVPIIVGLGVNFHEFT